jgi:hypothetical protein
MLEITTQLMLGENQMNFPGRLIGLTLTGVAIAWVLTIAGINIKPTVQQVEANPLFQSVTHEKAVDNTATPVVRLHDVSLTDTALTRIYAYQKEGGFENQTDATNSLIMQFTKNPKATVATSPKATAKTSKHKH